MKTEVRQGSTLEYSSYLGGSFDDSARAIAVDRFGGAFVTGTTGSPDFPLVNPLQSTIVRPTAFVSRFNPAGTSLVYSTYLGGSDRETGFAIALDSDGNAYVTGSTSSSDFPTLNAVQPAYGGKTLFKSTDAGSSWTSINNGIPGSAWVWSLVIDPASPSTIYAGTNTNGIYKTTDGGGDWVSSSLGLPDAPIVYDLAIDPLTPSNLFAGTFPSGLNSASVCKSTDSGASWSSTSGSPPSTALAIDPANPSTVFAGNANYGVFITTDGGASWEDAGFPSPQARVRSLAIDPTEHGAVYVGTDIGVTKLNGSGGFFEPNVGSVRCITVEPESPSTVYAGSSLRGIYKTTNSGGTWNQINAGLTELNVGTIAVDPTDPTIVYAGSPSHCYKSTNGGTSWDSITITPAR